MNDENNVPLDVAAVSDRGLSEKRPLNEDSYLSDPERRIFAVADGVGGAQAGEVASKTAVEVLDEAFRHQVNGTDIEDLMEIAIQRANSSIFQMSHEQAKLSAMATTVVALHLDGRIATFGHVGDSRLYRLSPDGQLHRETADHSVVEEEVRAGRMTPEQAAHHPSRNVISRALGAESGVEVDMKTIEVEDGTAFLLCTDGITRHLPDNELRELLLNAPNLEDVCAEMKRRCYERGAEDNLTAVIVRVGTPPPVADDELTVQSARIDLATTSPAVKITIPTDAPLQSAPVNAPMPAASTTLPPPPVSANNAHATNPVLSLGEQAKAQKRKGGGGGRAFLLLLLFLAIGAGAFYGGMYYQRQRGEAAQASASPTPTATPAAIDPLTAFEKNVEQVDKDPATMVKTLREKVASKDPGQPDDPEVLYLYGRALMLMGNNQEAVPAFERAILSAKENTSPVHDRLKVEARLAALAAAVRLKRSMPTAGNQAEQKAVTAFDELIKAPPANQLDLPQ